MSTLNNNDIENILNKTSKELFNESVDLKFKITPSQQVQLLLSGPVSAKHPYLKNRLLNKAKSNSVLSSIRRSSKYSSYSDIILRVLKEVTKGNFNWNEYINLNLNISEDIIKQAKETLEDHIDGVKEFFIDEILEKIKNMDVDIEKLNSLWSEYIAVPNLAVKTLVSFDSYSKIKEKIVYPYLELSCITGSVKLTESSSGHFVKVENNDFEIEKLKKTLEILEKHSEYIKKFVEINDIIDETIKEVELSNFNIDEDDYNKDNCISIYKNKMDKAINQYTLAGMLKIKSTTYNVCCSDMSIIKEAIVNLSDIISNDVKNQVEAEIRRKKERFNQPYVVEILTLINDFSKKGITTYTSILLGEKGDKITSNKYDTSESYGCMNSYSKTYVTNVLREFIDSGLILEETYKASFGRYTGLTLSKDSKEFIKNCNKAILSTSNNAPEIKIDSIETLLNELRGVSLSRATLLLKKCSEESIPFEKKDFNMLLKFIDKERPLYRDYEETFNTCVSKIVPNKYRPLFLLNSNFESGVTKKTLKSIYDMMEIID